MVEVLRKSFTDHELMQVVTCRICNKLMSNCHLLSPCTHSFCYKCIGRLPAVKNMDIAGIYCPLCKEFVQKTQIRPNSLMDVLIKVVNENGHYNNSTNCKSTSGASCLQCMKPNVTSFCVSCDIDLCDTCKETHLKLPGFKDHKTALKTEISAEELRNVVVFCSEHPGEQIKMNCQNCNQAICSLCKFEFHDCHKSESIPMALNRLRPLIENTLQTVEEKFDNKKKQIIEINRRKGLVKENYEKNKLRVTEIKKKMLEKLELEYHGMLAELDNNLATQIKHFDNQVESLEKSIKSQEGVKTWTEAILHNIDGSGLLIELQSGLTSKLDQIEREMDNIPVTCSLYKYLPSACLDGPILGRIIEVDNRSKSSESLNKTKEQIIKSIAKTQSCIEPKNMKHFQPFQVTTTKDAEGVKIETTFLNQQTTKTHKSIDYRILKSNLTHLCNKRIGQVNTTFTDIRENFDRSKFNTKMCLFQNKLWIPVGGEAGTIQIHSREIRFTETAWLSDVSKPCAICPINSDCLAVTSWSGLHVIDKKCRVKAELWPEPLDDVHVNTTTMAAVHCVVANDVQVKLIVWDIRELSQVDHTFCSSMKRNNSEPNAEYSRATVLVNNSHIYVSHTASSVVQKYSLAGELEEIDLGRLDTAPCLFAADVHGSLLLGDRRNDLVQIRSAKGKWFNLDLNIRKPMDVLVANNDLYALHNHGQTISAYKLL